MPSILKTKDGKPNRSTAFGFAKDPSVRVFCFWSLNFYDHGQDHRPAPCFVIKELSDLIADERL